MTHKNHLSLSLSVINQNTEVKNVHLVKLIAERESTKKHLTYKFEHIFGLILMQKTENCDNRRLLLTTKKYMYEKIKKITSIPYSM